MRFYYNFLKYYGKKKFRILIKEFTLLEFGIQFLAELSIKVINKIHVIYFSLYYNLK